MKYKEIYSNGGFDSVPVYNIFERMYRAVRSQIRWWMFTRRFHKLATNKRYFLKQATKAIEKGINDGSI